MAQMMLLLYSLKELSVDIVASSRWHLNAAHELISLPLLICEHTCKPANVSQLFLSPDHVTCSLLFFLLVLSRCFRDTEMLPPPCTLLQCSICYSAAHRVSHWASIWRMNISGQVDCYVAYTDTTWYAVIHRMEYLISTWTEQQVYYSLWAGWTGESDDELPFLSLWLLLTSRQITTDQQVTS